jgi:hypothetical protein
MGSFSMTGNLKWAREGVAVAMVNELYIEEKLKSLVEKRKADGRRAFLYLCSVSNKFYPEHAQRGRKGRSLPILDQ